MRWSQLKHIYATNAYEDIGVERAPGGDGWLIVVKFKGQFDRNLTTFFGRFIIFDTRKEAFEKLEELSGCTIDFVHVYWKRS